MRATELADIIREDIATGALVPGDRLESVRGMAERLKLGRGVVQEAIRQLRKAGVLCSRNRAGIYIATPEGSAERKRRRYAFYSHMSRISENDNRLFQALSQYALLCGCDLALGWNNGTIQPGKWAKMFDGLLVTGMVDDALTAELNAAGSNYLVIGNYDLHEPCANLTLDVKTSVTRMITEAHKRFRFDTLGVILFSPEMFAIREAMAQIRDLQTVCGFTLHDEDVFFDPVNEDGYRSMKLLMMRKRDLRPTRITCFRPKHLRCRSLYSGILCRCSRSSAADRTRF